MNSKFENDVKKYFFKIKKSNHPLSISIKDDQGNKIGVLELITWRDVGNKKLIRLLSRWRDAASWYFPSQFKVTNRGTSIWLRKALLEKEDRVLFLIKDLKGAPLGHMGLFTFDFEGKSCEIDNVIRGEKGVPGLMTFALYALINWTFENISIQKLYLKVFKDNIRAISLYERCGFIPKKNIPLYKRVEDETVYWEELEKEGKPDRYFLLMEYNK